MRPFGQTIMMAIMTPTLGLERSSNATEALEVITQLLKKYGQGGPCSKNDPGFAYHTVFNSRSNDCLDFRNIW
ncbi:hypothetical protein NQ317_005489 [Molorchus minor]|uniref:Uncharacterized protein n=1 Tax=Molorchus minor TaxID=1323400 RepID=A0ABQ9JTS9_9CUCU|nr:hypothetical protein NQ317_005489 [Molorchus minor]